MTSPSLLLRQFEIGPMENFVYLIGDAKTRRVFLVDPAWEIDTILKRVQQEDLTLEGAILTHHHYDHTNGIEELLGKIDVPIYVNQHDRPFVKTQTSVLTPVENGTQLQVGDITLTLLHTPGHTPGSQCIRVFDQLITGDTLFIDGCGRCDLPGGNAEALYDTFNQKILSLPEHTTIWPGHNYAAQNSDSLGHQKITNLFLKMASLSLKDFLKFRR